MNERKCANRIRVLTAWFGWLCRAGLLICAVLGVYFFRLAASAEDAYEPVEAVIPFECLNQEELSDPTYRIRLVTMAPDAPEPLEDTFDLDHEGKGEFRIRITEPGTFVYRAYQEKGSDINVKYDDTEYDIHVSVMNGEEGKLIYYMSVNYADTDIKPSNLEFTNMVESDSRGTETDTEDPESTTENTESDTESVTETTEKNTESSTGDSGKSTVKTGDDSGIFFELFFLSLIGILVIIIIKGISGKGGRDE